MEKDTTIVEFCEKHKITEIRKRTLPFYFFYKEKMKHKISIQMMQSLNFLLGYQNEKNVLLEIHLLDRLVITLAYLKIDKSYDWYIGYTCSKIRPPLPIYKIGDTNRDNVRDPIEPHADLVIREIRRIVFDYIRFCPQCLFRLKTLKSVRL